MDLKSFGIFSSIASYFADVYMDDGVILFYIEGKNNKEKNYLGIAIGVKIAKATKRNYIKRLIRENYKNLENSIETGNSIVFLWKKKTPIENAKYENIEKDMKKIFDKAEIIKEK